MANIVSGERLPITIYADAGATVSLLSILTANFW